MKPWDLSKEGEKVKCQSTLPASWETFMQVKKQQLDPDMEQWTGSKLGKEYIKVLQRRNQFWLHVGNCFFDLLLIL